MNGNQQSGQDKFPFIGSGLMNDDYSVEEMSLSDKQNYVANFPFCYCDRIDKYHIISKIGEGTYGEVFKAREKGTNNMFALKKIIMENQKQGFPLSSLREIQILQKVKHTNIVTLIGICRGNLTSLNSTFLVLEFCEHDLAGLINTKKVKFSLGEIKKVMQQLLNALYFLHFNKILHRDIKPSNILMTREGILKLADFGLGRAISLGEKSVKRQYTNLVVTLWYRSPELLLGDCHYGPAVDIWSVGCILPEMWARAPFMQGRTEQHQLKLISQLCGSVTPEIWPGVENLELYKSLDLPKNQRRRVKEFLQSKIKDPHALDLIDKLLILDPKKRMDANTALNHDFFWSDPMPVDLREKLSDFRESMFDYFN